MQKLPSIQVLRGIAVLLVVTLHLAAAELRFLSGAELLAAEGQVRPGLLLGNSGVDLFFIISGFVMAYTTIRPLPVAHFLWRRLMRIYPLYWLATALFLAGALLLPGAADQQRLKATNLIAAVLLLPQHGEPPLSVAWTLIHELYFYCTFALTLLFSRRLLPYLLCMWAAAVCSVQIVLGSEPAGFSPYMKVAASPLTLEFIAGALLCLILKKVRLNGRHALLAFLCAASLGVMTWRAESVSPSDEWGRVFAWGLPWLFGVVGFVAADIGRKGMYWLAHLGDASYSIYLLHCMVISVMYRLAAGLIGRIEVSSAALPVAAAAGAAALAVGLLSFAFVERPLLRLFKRGANTSSAETQNPRADRGEADDEQHDTHPLIKMDVAV